MRTPAATSRIRLSASDQERLREITKGAHPARVFKRARVLQLLAQGWRPTDVPAAAGVGEATARRVRARFEAEGLEAALFERSRPGAEPRLKPKQKARVIALACSEPPAGRDRWSVRLLVEEVKRRGVAKDVGRETIRILLRDHDLKPWREKNVVRDRPRR